MELRDQMGAYWRYARQHADAVRAFGYEHQLAVEARDELDLLAKWTDFETLRVACLKVTADAEAKMGRAAVAL